MNLQPDISSQITPEKKPVNPILVWIKKNITFRMSVQAFVVIIMIYAAWNFYGYYNYVRGNSISYTPYRPPSVEGFLPIAALVAFKAMFVNWQIDPIHPAGLVIFLAILVTAWIFRRALCSWICPLGTLSEYLGKLGKKVMGDNIKIPNWLDLVLVTLKYVIFFFVVNKFLLLTGEQALAFMQIPYYVISDIKMFEFFLNIGIIGALVIGIFMMLSFLFKSFFCRYLCPYGALLGILGVLSPIILKKNSDSCIECGKCNKVCPSRVDVMGKKHVVISTECQGCTSCVTACPKEKTLEFKLFGLLPIKPLIYSVSFIAVFWGIIIIAMATGHWESTANANDYRAIYQQMSGGF